jgi:hypothetical protein
MQAIGRRRRLDDARCLHTSSMSRILLAIAAMAAAGGCGSPSLSSSSEKVEIVRDSGLKQCDEQKPAPEAFSKLLQANGVKVFSAACASDGAMRAQMCGMDRGLFYIYEIDRSALPKALGLGFTEIQRGSRFKRIPCV